MIGSERAEPRKLSCSTEEIEKYRISRPDVATNMTGFAGSDSGSRIRSCIAPLFPLIVWSLVEGGSQIIMSPSAPPEMIRLCWPTRTDKRHLMKSTWALKLSPVGFVCWTGHLQMDLSQHPTKRLAPGPKQMLVKGAAGPV